MSINDFEVNMVEEIKQSRDQGDAPQEHGHGTVPNSEPAGREQQDAAASSPDEGAETGDQGAETDAEQVTRETLYQEIESLRQQVAEHLDKAMRSQAELENLRKRTAREIENAHKYGLDRFIKELLPVIDSMELGISASANADEVAGLRAGMDLTLKMFIDVLNKSGVEVIDPQGEKFNPELHEAVSVQALEGGQAGTVIAVMQKGYSLNGRLVRPAMVVVAR